MITKKTVFRVCRVSVVMDSELVPPEQFRFPFEPYDIQKDFMRELFNCLQSGKLGIFESPTGTGKSLSLICGSLTWFLESEKANKVKLEKLLSDKFVDEDDDWFAAAGRKQEHNQKRLEAKKALERIKLREEKLANIKKRRGEVQQAEIDRNKDEFEELFKEVRSIKKAVERELSQGPGDEDILLEEYFSDDEGGDDVGEEGEEEEEDSTRRIYFCSRTHSQLSQFVREVKKSPFSESVSLVSLASRGVLCVNPAVKKLRSQAAINEACLELGRKKSKPTVVDDDERTVKKSRKGGGGGCGCPYNKTSRTGLLRDKSVMSIHDIEDLVTAGRRTTSCPYYASRSAVPLAQLIVLPYNTLLHAGTRRALGTSISQGRPPSQLSHFRSEPEEQHRHHRRGPQPAGHHHQHPQRLPVRQPAGRGSQPAPAVQTAVQRQTEGQESSLHQADPLHPLQFCQTARWSPRQGSQGSGEARGQRGDQAGGDLRVPVRDSDLQPGLAQADQVLQHQPDLLQTERFC